jgi:hypothetical protein
MANDTKRLTREQVIGRIKKLLSRTVERGATEEEAATCVSLASELLLEYGLSQRELEDRTTTMREASINCSPRKSRGNRMWYMNIAKQLASNCGCTALLVSGSFKLLFIGEEVDVEVLIALYTYIIEQIEYLCYKTCFNIPDTYDWPEEQVRYWLLNGISLRVPIKWNVNQNRPPMNANKFYNAFFLGCSHRTVERLKEARAEQVVRHAARGSQALVLVKDALVKEHLKTHAQRLGLQQVHVKASINSKLAYSLGYAKGDEVNLEHRVPIGGARG